MSKRVLAALLTLVIGYFAVYFGDGLHVWSAADVNAPPHDWQGFVIGPVIVGQVIITLFGALAWWAMMNDFVHHWSVSVNNEIARSAIAFICFACVFGVLAAPFSTYGAYPWHWASRLDVIPLLASAPLAIVIHGIFADIAEARHRRKIERNNITPIRRA